MNIGDLVDIRLLVWNDKDKEVQEEWTTGVIEDIGQHKFLVKFRSGYVQMSKDPNVPMWRNIRRPE